MELIESLKNAAADCANVDTAELWERYLLAKREFLEVEAENLFLEDCLNSEGEQPENFTESELQALQKQLADLRYTSKIETEEIESLIGAFTDEMENFPHLLDSALTFFDECDKKMPSMETSDVLENNMEETSLLNAETDEDWEHKARELAFLTGNVEIEIVELEAKISKQKECLKRIQNLHTTHTKLDLLHKILSFISDWTIVGCEDNTVVLAFKNSATKQKKAIQKKHMKPSKEVEYKLHVKVHPKTFAIDNAQLEPQSDFLIDDLLQEMAFRRTMHSLEVSAEPPNDLEFLLRRVGQQIMSSKK